MLSAYFAHSSKLTLPLPGRVAWARMRSDSHCLRCTTVDAKTLHDLFTVILVPQFIRYKVQRAMQHCKYSRMAFAVEGSGFWAQGLELQV